MTFKWTFLIRQLIYPFTCAACIEGWEKKQHKFWSNLPFSVDLSPSLSFDYFPARKLPRPSPYCFVSPTISSENRWPFLPLPLFSETLNQSNMAGAQFEYDEKGTTFYYFLISFYGIVLAPVTYYIWRVTKLPGKSKDPSGRTQKQRCKILIRVKLSWFF